MESNCNFAAGIVDPVSDFGVVFIDGKASGEEDGEGENEA